MNWGLGIDTGGTYTDSVILDLSSGRVLSKAKALTTREDLSVGMANSMDLLDSELLDRVNLVSISSTLATNSVVEGKGCRVGLIVIGKEFENKVQIERLIQVNGGHDLDGEEIGELDLGYAREAVLEAKEEVDAFAVSGYLSVRNPEHEIAVKEMVEAVASLPVVCGHELSSDLGFNERTVTAVLNARLIPIISELVSSVKEILKKYHIKAPLMIMKGDGSIMKESVAMDKPVETILSGPVASLTGARFLTGEDDAVVIDMGGTTTDIGILRNGRPRLDPIGATIGGWKTRVRAIDVHTSGVGGDSRIVTSDGNIHVTPLRVTPICIADHLYSGLREKVSNLSGFDASPKTAFQDFNKFPQTTDFFISIKEVENLKLSDNERCIVEMVGEGPCSLQEIREATGLPPLSFGLRRLERFGIVQRIGLTPTDILHVDGSYREYGSEASRIAVQVHSERYGTDVKTFCREVKEAVVDKVSRELLKKLFHEETGKMPEGQVAEHLLEMFVTRKNTLDYSCQLTLLKKIIGIGAPVTAYLPQVADKFETTLLIPEHMEIGNAVGAITGSIVEEIEMLIRPKSFMGELEDPPCIVHSPEEKLEFESYSEALKYARDKGTVSARKKADLAGAADVEITVDIDDTIVEAGEERSVLIETKVVIKAMGKPLGFFEK